MPYIIMADLERDPCMILLPRIPIQVQIFHQTGHKGCCCWGSAPQKSNRTSVEGVLCLVGEVSTGPSGRQVASRFPRA